MLVVSEWRAVGVADRDPAMECPLQMSVSQLVDGPVFDGDIKLTLTRQC